jgi:hypothetical protein
MKHTLPLCAIIYDAVYNSRDHPTADTRHSYRL